MSGGRRGRGLSLSQGGALQLHRRRHAFGRRRRVARALAAVVRARRTHRTHRARARFRLDAARASDTIEIVWLVAVHPQKMFLDVIRAIKLFLTKIAMERFLVAMDVFVTREEIAAVGCVRARAAHVAFAGVAERTGFAARGVCCRARPAATPCGPRTRASLAAHSLHLMIMSGHSISLFD